MIKQSSTRTNQGGSILIFTIVAVVLALILVGAVMFIRNKGEVAQTQVPIMGPVMPPSEAPSDTPSDDKAKEGANNSSQSENSSKPQNSPTSNDSSSQTNAPSAASELPKTGPADLVGGALIIALVTMSLVSYLRSRQLSWQL